MGPLWVPTGASWWHGTPNEKITWKISETLVIQPLFQAKRCLMLNLQDYWSIFIRICIIQSLTARKSRGPNYWRPDKQGLAKYKYTIAVPRTVRYISSSRQVCLSSNAFLLLTEICLAHFENTNKHISCIKFHGYLWFNRGFILMYTDLCKNAEIAKNAEP